MMTMDDQDSCFFFDGGVVLSFYSLKDDINKRDAIHQE